MNQDKTRHGFPRECQNKRSPMRIRSDIHRSRKICRASNETSANNILDKKCPVVIDEVVPALGSQRAKPTTSECWRQSKSNKTSDPDRSRPRLGTKSTRPGLIIQKGARVNPKRSPVFPRKCEEPYWMASRVGYILNPWKLRPNLTHKSTVLDTPLGYI